MTAPHEIERKVRQLDSDVSAIYDMLSRISKAESQQNIKLDELATIQSEHGRILGEHGRILGEHSATLDSHGEKLDAILELLRGRAG